MSSVVAPQYLQKLFEKDLTETDTKHRLAFPSEHLLHLCTNPKECRSTPVDFEVTDRDGNPFVFRLRVRTEGFLKPEITGDWLRFIRAKSLKPYDRVIFYKHPINNNGVLFTVAVRRVARVFGAVLGYAEQIE